MTDVPFAVAGYCYGIRSERKLPGSRAALGVPLLQDRHRGQGSAPPRAALAADVSYRWMLTKRRRVGQNRPRAICKAVVILIR